MGYRAHGSTVLPSSQVNPYQRKENRIATAAVLTRQTRLTPLTLWHLLSLDAPTVATIWTVFAARVLHTALPPSLAPAMFLTVWLLYAGDRLLDAHPLTPPRWIPQVPAQSHRADPGITPPHLQPRHHFHRTHRIPFAVTILIAAPALATLIPTLPQALLRPYLALAALLAIWFALIHLTHLPLPKEFAPGLFFAAAIFLPIPHSLFPATLFAALCTLNCFYIHLWEHPSARRVPHPHDSLIVVRVGLGRRPIRPAPRPTAPPNVDAAPNPNPATAFSIRHLPQLTLALALLSLTSPSPIPIAIALSALALLALDYHSHNLPPTTLRAAADLALLTPILILPLL